MTKKEAAIISAYTGILIIDFKVLHEYIEQKLERPVMTHELGEFETIVEIKEKSEEDFLKLMSELT